MRYTPIPVAAGATRALVTAGSTDVHGFLCTTAGNFQIAANVDGSGASIIASVAMTAGQYLRIPGVFATPCAIVLTGGCAGTLFANQQ